MRRDALLLLLSPLACGALACGADEPLPACALPEGLPVFPGAEGFGSTTPAGRGGQVLEVTTLADAGPGSLRAALEAEGPRTIVFRLGGAIELASHLELRAPFVTIAGQTAPAPGITLTGAGVVVFTHDVLIQHLRVRPGRGPVKPEHNDAIALLGEHDDSGPGAFNVVLDHVSTSWGEDETVSAYYGAHDVTISWSIISEALDESRHPKGTHSAGLLLGDRSNCVSVHHNLLAHNDFRNPLVAGGGTHDVVANLVYNWGALAAEVVQDGVPTRVNFVGNIFKPGPDSTTTLHEILYSGDAPQLFVEDNLGPTRPDPEDDDWASVGFEWDLEPAPAEARAATRFAAPAVSHDPRVTESVVLAGAGATRPRRDAVDARVAMEVTSGGGRIIDAPGDVGGLPQSSRLPGGGAPPDRDHDGMPDAWEQARGLDPDDPTDSAEIIAEGSADDGYSNLERYLHSLL
ncbi:MAG: pectate lyase [Myxococcales bacterium]|nr:pectate lyase [Myxococcales bacterium]